MNGKQRQSPMTRKSPNKLWAFGPFISVLLIVVAYYLKVPAFRDAVNTRFPWAKEHLSRFVPPPEVVIIRDPPKAPVEMPLEEPPRSLPSIVNTPSRTPPLAATPKSRERAMTLRDFTADPSLWPKTVRLLRAIEFPAVLDRKVIGKIRAPAGTEARLVTVKDQQVGVEYRGGGAWVSIGETDLMERARITAR
jgi:hypothetical protein